MLELQLLQPVDFVLDLKRDVQRTASDHVQDRQRIAAEALDEELRFGQYRFAGQQRSRESLKLLNRPVMMLVSSDEQSNQRAAIDESSFDVGHPGNPFESPRRGDANLSRRRLGRAEIR